MIDETEAGRVRPDTKRERKYGHGAGAGVPQQLAECEAEVVGAIDDLLKTGRQEPDPAKRLGLYQDAERRIMDMVPIIPIAQFQTQSVIGERVAGLVVNPLGTFDAAAVWLTR